MKDVEERGTVKHPIPALFVCMASLVASTAPVFANCFSLVGRPEWPLIAGAVSSAQVCEQLPAGPNQTRSFRVQSAELCRGVDQNSTLRATAIVTCESPPDALFEMPPMQSEIAVIVSVNERACKITDAQIQIGGELGSLLPGTVDASELARRWTGSQLSQLCQMR
ncbi:hypothetical protein AGROH133_13172 [Agrobacterium tumefaciens]|nr:hypothetical protein AGROH133_13172 [Agrobacterium tumefaciens]